MNSTTLGVLFLVIGFFVVSLYVNRLPYRTLGYARIAGGVALIALSLGPWSEPATRWSFGLAGFGLFMAAWGIWMIRSPRAPLSTG